MSCARLDVPFSLFCVSLIRTLGPGCDDDGDDTGTAVGKGVEGSSPGMVASAGNNDGGVATACFGWHLVYLSSQPAPAAAPYV